MQLSVRRSLSVFLLLSSVWLVRAAAQRSANAHAVYQQLRALEPGSDVITAHNLELKRDAATFAFADGSFAFYNAVNGKITGAVFKGRGHLHITPPTAQERHSLSILMQTEEFDEDFDQAVLRFTDGTAAELGKAASGTGQPDASYGKEAQNLQEFSRHTLHDNFDLRLLEDVLSPASGGAFMAYIHGHKDGRLLFLLDPQGVESVAPEEVALLNWRTMDGAVSYPLAFHRAQEYASGTARSDENHSAYAITGEHLDVTIEKSGFLTCLATVDIRAEQDGVAVIPLDLYATLRVSSVQSAKGDALDFVQEGKDNDPDFGVVLPAPLKKGETTTLKIAYGGKDVVMNEGNGNYYPVARENWYPNNNLGFGRYTTYSMTFHVPKGLELIATGDKVSETTEGKITTTEWKTEQPLPVVGFSIGDFSTKQVKLGKVLSDQLTVDAYANNGKPDFLESASGGVLGALATTPMLANELNQGATAAQIYTNIFGPLPFSHISLTQQSACDYGQSWPMLVYLPICGFFDTTQQHFLGLGGENLNKHMYWEVVTPHEVAHQWWGQTVGFGSYRDQWMSEGFADASAAMFLQATRNKPDDYLRFWKEERTAITEKNEFGFRPNDVGPVTMGFRLSSPKAGWNIYGDLVYPKGAYILHMMRMMMWSPKEGDARFNAAMHGFVSAHMLQPATTEDFKAAMEKYMSTSMDLDSNHRMDWFFNEYVYGTELPTYHFESQVAPNPDGTTALHVKLVQSGVSADFKMPVPLYLELADGHVMRMGVVNMVGDKTFEHTITVPKLPAAVKRATINYYYDVLSVGD